MIAVTILVGHPTLAGTIEGRILRADPAADLSNFVISLENSEGPIPPPTEPAVMAQKDLRFVPHILVVQVGTTVEFPNNDPLSHNVFSFSDAKRFNLGLYARGTIRRVRFDHPGVVELLCNVHLEMSAYIVVVENPYFARTGDDGTFSIQNVPAGRHWLRGWHERLPLQEQEIEVPAEGTVQVVFDMGS